MNRLSLTEDDVKARRWLAHELRTLECKVDVDELGNMFGRRQGKKSMLAMIAMGSHLDTQPRGGRYDGILGVLGAVEVLKTLKENGYQTYHDVGIVNWTKLVFSVFAHQLVNANNSSEEGARFPKSMMASGVWAGKIPREEALNLADIFDSSKTVASELARFNLAGPVACSYEANPLLAHFELHIEQGPILEDTGCKIGVVEGAQAYKWFTVNIEGRDAHTGTTPLCNRSDPVLAASKMIAAAHTTAKSKGATASVGILKVPKTSSTNTVAAEVTFSLDVRHPDDVVVAAVLDEVFAAFHSISKEDGKGVKVSWTLDTDSPAVKFDKNCIDAVSRAAENVAGKAGWRHITSGAGHDSVYTSKHCPTAMIFVPCKHGVSHHPEEYCSPEDW